MRKKILTQEEQLRIFGVSSPKCKLTWEGLRNITKNPYQFLDRPLHKSIKVTDLKKEREYEKSTNRNIQ